MPLFPMITHWQHTDMSWPHPIFGSLKYFCNEDKDTHKLFRAFCFFSFLSRKHRLCEEISHAVHKKAQQLFTDKTKKARVTFKQCPSSSCSVCECMICKMIIRYFWIMDPQIICDEEEPFVKTQVGSIALIMLLCTFWVCCVLNATH